MKVDDYAFGRITIDGHAYAKDVLVLPGRGVHSPWWRQAGHNLVPEDLTAVLADPPEMLVIGTGYHGNMAVPEATLQVLRESGVAPWVGRTGEAVAELNRLQERSSRIAAALHLTC